MTVFVTGPVGKETGWIIDFSEISDAVKPVLQRLDHYYLNEIEGLENPTSENLARWVWQRVRPNLPLMTKLIVKETCNCGCIYQGDDL
jgi:6-pyruvoyltetrahydropterin/6-carboxytetrahydropterin synthase